MGVWGSTDPKDQDWNPYSYCGLNPNNRIDPNGEFWNVIGAIVGASAGAYLGGVMSNIGTDHPFNPRNWDWENSGTFMGLFSGALSGGMMGYGIGANIDARIALHQANAINTDLAGPEPVQVAGEAVDPRDPECLDLANKITERRNELAQRYKALQKDKSDLFNGKNPQKGTWSGHQDQYNGQQRNLGKLIQQFNDKGCGGGLLPSDVANWRTMPVPSAPLPKPNIGIPFIQNGAKVGLAGIGLYAAFKIIEFAIFPPLILVTP